VFRNDETSSIEAVLTFPSSACGPVRSRSQDRNLGCCVPKRSAIKLRASYEKGIDEGKASVLHEELLPGIHMLSVEQVGAGATIEVISRSAMAATHPRSKHLKNSADGWRRLRPLEPNWTNSTGGLSPTGSTTSVAAPRSGLHHHPGFAKGGVWPQIRIEIVEMFHPPA
jgi:hypothetical protein